jgi:hypothetical protein
LQTKAAEFSFSFYSFTQQIKEADLYSCGFMGLIPENAVGEPTWRVGDEWRLFAVLSLILMVT